MFCIIIYDYAPYMSSLKSSVLMTLVTRSDGTRFGLSPRTSYKGTLIEGSKPMADDEKAWEELAKNTLRAAMMQRGISYAALAERLETIGVHDNELNLRNKVSRGRFTAVFLMQCLKALDAEWIHIPSNIDEATGKSGAQFLARRDGPAK